MKVETTCQNCGKTFFVEKSELNRGWGKYCSISCTAKMPKPLQYEMVCKHCGQTFMAASKIAQYCSDSCKQKSYRFRQKPLDATISVRGLRKVFKDLPCEICGWDKAGRDRHHITTVSEGGKDTVENLINVCPNCHREIHAGLIPKEDLFEIAKNRNLK